MTGIFEPHREFYRVSITYSIVRGLKAFERYQKTFNEGGKESEIFGHVQEALSQSAMVSKFFWPSPKKSSERGEILRSMYSISENSPLKSRTLRNTFEHFDEKLDDYLDDFPVGYIFPTPRIIDHSTADEPILHYFKALDPKNEVCILLGRKFYFRPIWDALTALPATE